MRRKTLLLFAVVMVFMVLAGRPASAQSGATWTIYYYDNPDWAGSPILGTYSPYIDFNWGTVPPGPGMPSEYWTATMTSSPYFPYAGTYVFQALADDEITVQIDGFTYINTIGAGASGKTVQAAVTLSQGYHNIVVQYRQYSGAAYVYLNWAYAKPGGGYEYTPLPVPMPPAPPASSAPAPTPTPAPSCDPWWSCTCPTQAASVSTPYGVYTACIEQNLHQSACFVSSGQWDSPNQGSIETEPQIQVWEACTPGELQCMQLACNQEPVQATCSKTGAGWFYYGECPQP
ncbi:MAG: PA14 domain-containing protein [Caldilinea sp.]